ncbi:MAG: Dabb family protein [Clostridiales bacterium]|jgi:hypothetical protein|nr:Dabb family protein [Clostridiales bacterium]
MIQHIVLYKFEGISSGTLAQIKNKFEQCKAELSGIKELHFGENVSLKKHLDHGFNYALFMVFENVDVIKTYNELQAHKDAQTLMADYQNGVLVFDIEC